MSRPSRGARGFRALVRALLPARFRENHGAELVGVFQDLMREARAAGPFAVVHLWGREVSTLIRLAWRLRRGRDRSGFASGPGFASGVSMLDLKLGMRMLAKQPALTLVAVFALAVAIPVGLVPEHFTTAIEAPLPVEDGERVRVIRHRDLARSSESPLPLEDFEAWRATLESFGELAVTTIRAQFNVISEDGRAAPVAGAVVTASAFAVLRVRPFRGRTLLPGDELPGGPDVVVIGYDLWQTRLAGTPDAVGLSIRIGGVPHTVVGIMPDGFEFPFRDHLWLPLRTDVVRSGGAGLGAYQVFGRLAPDVTREEALAEVATRDARASDGGPESSTDRRMRTEVVTFAEGFFGLPDGGFKATAAYFGVQILTLLLLAVACANVGMLVFAKTAARTSELAVRTAIGASRRRIITQLFTEALVFAVLAAGTGLLIADRVSIGFGWMTQALPYWADLRVGMDTVLQAMALAVLSAGLVSVVPALKVTGRTVQRSIQQAAAGRNGIRFGGVSSALIVMDVMLAVIAIGVAVGLSDILTRPTDSTGIDSDAYLYAEIRIPRIDPGGAQVDTAAFRQRVAETQTNLALRLEAEPVVRGVAVANVLPGMDHPGGRVELEGGAPDLENRASVRRAGVDIRYFDALDQPILSGRGFGQADISGAARAVIVNTTFVEKVLRGRSALGQRLRYLGRNGAEAGAWQEIVGVVGSLGMNEAIPGADAGVYHPTAPGAIHPMRFAIHVGADPEQLTPRLRALVGEVDPTAIVSEAMPLNEVFSFNTFTMRWIGIGAWTLIGILIALSASGIFALMSFTVVQRTREIGIRTALGARAGDVARAIARRSMAQLAVGILLGMPITWRLLFEFQRDLDRIQNQSPLLLALACGIGAMMVIGLIACVIPTRRALRIMPTEALRSEI